MSNLEINLAFLNSISLEKREAVLSYISGSLKATYAETIDLLLKGNPKNISDYITDEESEQGKEVAVAYQKFTQSHLLQHIIK
jgi:hypothetical protein